MSAEADTLRIAELEENNRRLRRLLDQRDAPGELRHRLRGTLAVLRAIIRKSAETGRDLADYVAQLEDRLDAIARAQAYADQHGTVDLRGLLAEELFQYGAVEAERLLLSGPEVSLPPREGQVLALAVHELAINAVEHGALGADRGRIEIAWQMEADAPGRRLILRWAEFGPSPATGPARSGFGTEVLTRLLPYELKARTQIAYGSDGLACTVLLPLPG